MKNRKLILAESLEVVKSILVTVIEVERFSTSLIQIVDRIDAGELDCSGSSNFTQLKQLLLEANSLQNLLSKQLSDFSDSLSAIEGRLRTVFPQKELVPNDCLKAIDGCEQSLQVSHDSLSKLGGAVQLLKERIELAV